MNTFVDQSKEIYKKNTKDGIKLYIKRLGCGCGSGSGCWCLIIFILFAIIASCVASFGDDKEQDESALQPKDQNVVVKPKSNIEQERKSEVTQFSEEITVDDNNKQEVAQSSESYNKENENKSEVIQSPESKSEENVNKSAVTESKEKEAQKTKDKNEGCTNPKIKGNISGGEKIYHVPGGAYYEKTEAEEMFCTEAEAIAKGYRKSKR
ncbi:sunset domain-containing protein [Calidifontibacillus erzurumensis]|uniref:Uncharacterized protein n=1 Tax=Calidifontibacillus erzurumensis TaxID=2741433 RepID=A0A8J8GC93_9BACI|nr:hypothetical protein [Calidifontibacillus erzurumensis]NSL50516.1 hypothetical protein [Calidifontibacillus erzurumensis]